MKIAAGVGAGEKAKFSSSVERNQWPMLNIKNSSSSSVHMLLRSKDVHIQKNHLKEQRKEVGV